MDILRFFRKKYKIKEHEDVLTKWLERIIDLEQRINRLELENDDFRDKILRKIQRRQDILEPPQPQKFKKRFGGQSNLR